MMENKPKFCSECGAKLTGSAAFCPECGAKQEFATAPVAAPAPAPAPVVEPVVVPVAAVVEPVVIPAPVATAAPVVSPAPVAAPDNSLAAPKKAGISVFGLILAIGAIMITGIAFFLQFVSVSRGWVFKIDFSLLGQFLRSRGVLVGILTSYVVPIVAILAVLIKKKPVALVGMILIAVCMLAQFLVMLLFSRVVTGRILTNFFGRLFLRLMNWVNGDNLLYNLRNIFRSGRLHLRSLFSAGMVSSFFYWCKNLLAILACLMVMVKKQK